MLSELPIDIKKIGKGDLDRSILRVGMIAELDAINLYEQLSAMTDNKTLKKNSFGYSKRGKDTYGGIFDAFAGRR
jgi:hypothetical protein